MTDPEANVIIAIVALIGTSVSTGGLIYMARIASRVGKVSNQVATVASDLTRVELKVDGKMDRLLEASVGRATAEGIATGEQSERDRSAVPLPATGAPTPVTIANSPDSPVPVEEATLRAPKP